VIVQEDALRRQGISFASLAGVVMAAIFIGVNLMRGLPMVALFNLAIVAALLGCQVWLRRGARLVPSAIAVLSLLMLFVVASLVPLGTKALFWPYTLPVMAFFLLGARSGWWFVGIWSAVLLAIFTVGGRPAELSLDGRLEMLLSFLSVAVVAYLLEHMRVRYVGQIRDLARREEQANRAKDRFLAHMSHELRTPLNAILGFSQILGRDETVPQKLRPHLDRIHVSGQNLLSLVDTVLDYSRLDTGEMDCRPERYEVETLLAEVAEVSRVLATAKGQSLEITVRDGGMHVADRRLLKQALLNLVTNAVKFTPEGGRVCLESDLDGPERVFRVSDSGIGIAPGELETVFQPFAQVDGHFQESVKGSGLGLAIVKKVVEELHGGRVRVNSEPGVGTVFTLHLPASAAPAGTPAEPEPLATVDA